MRRLLLAFALAAAASPSTAARADGWTFSGDTGVTPLGYDIAARGGYRLGPPLVTLTPEVGLRTTETDDMPLNGPFVGARLAILTLVEPSVYAWYGNAIDVGRTCTVGAALDLTAIPKVAVGAHYSRLSFCEGPWLPTLGLHAGVAL